MIRARIDRAERIAAVCKVVIDLLHDRRLRVVEVDKHESADTRCHLIHQSGRLSIVHVLRVLPDLCNFNCGDLSVGKQAVQNAANQHLKRRRAGKPAAPEHVAGGIGIEATHRLSQCPEAFRNAPDQAGRMGALALLRLGLAQINDIQFVEAPGFDPDKTVVTGGCHCDQIQRHRCRKTIPVLMIGVVAAQLRPARSRVDMHLPPGAIVQLKLFQRGGIPLPLADQHRRFCAIERAERFVPLPRKDLPSELCTGRHGRSSSTNVLRKVRA